MPELAQSLSDQLALDSQLHFLMAWVNNYWLPSLIPENWYQNIRTLGTQNKNILE